MKSANVTFPETSVMIGCACGSQLATTVPDFRPDAVEVQLTPGTSVSSYTATVEAAGLAADPNTDVGSFVVIASGEATGPTLGSS